MKVCLYDLKRKKQNVSEEQLNEQENNIRKNRFIHLATYMRLKLSPLVKLQYLIEKKGKM